MSRGAVTGHVDLTAATVRLVHQTITDALLPHATGESTGLSCLARGADPLFARAVLELGGSLEAVLPAADHRAEKVRPDHAPEFDDLLRRGRHRMPRRTRRAEARAHARGYSSRSSAPRRSSPACSRP